MYILWLTASDVTARRDCTDLDGMISIWVFHCFKIKVESLTYCLQAASVLYQRDGHVADKKLSLD